MGNWRLALALGAVHGCGLGVTDPLVVQGAQTRSFVCKIAHPVYVSDLLKEN